MNRDRLRILLINYRDITNPRAGGAEVHLHEIFKRIAGMGHKVDLLCSRYSGSTSRQVIDGIRIARTGREPYFNFRAQMFLLRLKPNTYDIVIEDVNKIPVYSPVFTKIPTLLIVPHLFGTTVFQEASVPIALYVYLWELLIPYIYRGLEVEVISESTKRDLVRRGFDPRKIHIIYCGTATDLYFPDDDDKHEPQFPYIVCIGRLKKYKRMDLVINAFSNLGNEHSKVRLLIIGDGDHVHALKRLSRRLGIHKKVVFVGHVSESEKVRFLRGAEFVVNTSPKEGWGLTNIEAQACGIPVLASDSPGLSESVRNGETGMLVPHGDIEALTDAMKTLLSDGTLRKKLGMRAAEWSRGFSWEQAAEETMQLIFKVHRNSHDL
ncbi:MAG: glycosyltransferase family 4 protein [Candidatus Glassbacteria bacterium]